MADLQQEKLRLREMSERQAAFQSLLKSPGWDLLAEIVEEWISKNLKTAEQPIKDMAGALEHNLALGRLEGMRAVFNLPMHQLRAAEDMAEGVRVAIQKLEAMNERGKGTTES